MIAGFNLSVYQATPFIIGSALDASGMTLVYQGAPFMVANQQPGFTYTMDSRSRLAQVNLTNQSTIVYSLDDTGNRTSVVVTCGPNGC